MINEATFACRAVLFDLDGVLVDSTGRVEQTWKDWAGHHGLDPDRVLEVAHGRRTVETIRAIAPHLSAEDEAQKLEKAEAEDMTGVKEVSGAAGLVNSLPPGSWAIVTSGTRAVATARLLYTGLPVPETLITADEVDKGKPHPEGYLSAANLLGVTPEHCLVIEDAPAGIQAAREAGIRVIGVAGTYTASELSGSSTVVQNLEDVVLERIFRNEGEIRMELLTREAGT